jgi:hypothetical protein
MSGQPSEDGLVEDLADEPKPEFGAHLPSVRDGDPCRLLATVLEGIEGEER